MTGILLNMFRSSFAFPISKLVITKPFSLSCIKMLRTIHSNASPSNIFLYNVHNMDRSSNYSKPITLFHRYYSNKEKNINFAPTDTSLSHQGTSNEKGPKSGSKFKKYAIYTICIFYGTMFILILYNLGQPSLDEDGHEIADEFSNLPPIEQFFKRMFDRLYIFKEFIRRPSSDKLLPNPAPIGQPKYTLVLELTHVLLHPDWTYQTGWRFKKRPNVDHFLEQLASPLFEIVVFTTQIGMNMSPIVDVLNKSSAIKYTLYRDATDFINGDHVKNLNCLNRDLSKVIVIDWNPNSVQLHPENALILPKWTGNDDDNILVELVAFLKNVADKSPDDVRDILTYYKQYEDPIEAFRENKRQLPTVAQVPSA